MKRFILSLLIGAVAGCATAEEATNAAPAAKNPVAVVKVGPVDDALVERLQAWVKESIAVDLPVLEAREWTYESMDQAGAHVAESLKPEDLGVVVLAWPDKDMQGHSVSMLENRVVVVNVRGMKTEGADDETVGRRVERLVMRAIGQLTHMPACPNMMCALAQYNSMETLDLIGRNYCPPCARRFQELMRDQHIHLDPQSPFYMLELPQAP